MSSIKNMSKQNSENSFIKLVLSYHNQYGRHDLVWRKKITAYRIIVSEIMLQQTQVARVLPKFNQWMTLYPTLKELRIATFKDILILWQGLGYQRRAKTLCDISQSYTRIPSSYEKLLEIKGIGKYTAGAVCAFACNKFTYPLLETNIRTALIEQFHQREDDIHDHILYDDLLRLEKNSRVQKVGARIWYYALMDYGAHLKQQKISHNIKSVHHVKQSPYRGSTRELRAKILFAVTHGNKLPLDDRTETQLKILTKEGYIIQRGSKYIIAESNK